MCHHRCPLYLNDPPPGDYGKVSMCLPVAYMYVGVASRPIEPCGCLVLFQSESVWMSFLHSFLLGRGSMGWIWESSAYSYYTRKEEDHERRASLEWNFKSLCSTEKGRSSAQNFLSFILESFGVCSVKHRGCNELDWGPLWPQRWIRCLQHQQSVLGDAELHSTGSGYTFKMN